MTTTINASTTLGLQQTADTSGILQLQTANTAALTIDASQNVGIGTSSPAAKLQLYTPAATTNFTIQSDSANIGGVFFNDGANSGAIQYDHATDYMSFRTSGSERARIDSSGNLLVATTSQIFSGKVCIAVPLSTFNSLALQNTTTQGAGQSFMYMANSAGNKAGSIDHTGTTTVAYTTSSDYRMKENIVPMTGALNTVLQLNPCTYTWKEDGKEGQGFIAHELQAVVPDCVSGEKDAVDEDGNPKYQGIDTSFLVATLTAAIKEQQALITTLTERVAALETK